VAGVEPANRPVGATPALAGRSNLALRVASSLILAPLALVLAYLGGWPFTIFWSIAAAIVLSEWLMLVVGRNPFVLFPWSGAQWLWALCGAVYAGVLLAATLVLRADVSLGFAAIVFVFAVVWGSDIVAYFVGRAVGGPKLMPRVSPKKTWSGAVGGTLASIILGVLVAKFAGLGNLGAVALMALVLSVASQAGDLLESALKRHFDVKDSSGLLPGHGGLMDRLDGYLTAVVAAALIGLARGGFDAPARGLLVW
jgi:phosphatidate cytidylyltransferase